MRILILIGALTLAACTPARELPNLQCTVDDTLSFTATEVTRLSFNGSGLIVVRKGDLAAIRRNMLPGETCTRVAEINWELAR